MFLPLWCLFPINKNIAGDRGSFVVMVSGQGRSHGEGNGKGKEKISGGRVKNYREFTAK